MNNANTIASLEAFAKSLGLPRITSTTIIRKFVIRGNRNDYDGARREIQAAADKRRKPTYNVAPGTPVITDPALLLPAWSVTTSQMEKFNRVYGKVSNAPDTKQYGRVAGLIAYAQAGV